VKSENKEGQIRHLNVHPLPKNKIIFWDTSFVIDTLFSPNLERIKKLEGGIKSLTPEENKELDKLKFLKHRHDAAVKFTEQLIKENFNVAFSSILFQEVYFVCKYIVLDKIYKTREKTQTEIKNNPTIIKSNIPDIMKNWNLFMELLSKFKNRIFPITPSDPLIIQETLRIRVEYLLNPNDSMHLGTILVGKQKNIVVFDKKFKDAALKEGLDVWYRV